MKKIKEQVMYQEKIFAILVLYNIDKETTTP